MHNNPVRLTDPTGMEADDDYVINDKGMVTNIIRTDKPDRIIMEDGTNIPFNDPSQDRTELKNYKKGDQLVQFIDKRKLEFIMKKVGAGQEKGILFLILLISSILHIALFQKIIPINILKKILMVEEEVDLNILK